MRHVTVGKAIDWQQWQLDQAVRSIRFQVDKDNDLYALPVVVIDPTGDKVIAQGATVLDWEWLATSVSAIATDVHMPATGFTTFLDQYEVCFGGDRLAVAAVNYLLFIDPAVGVLHDLAWWCEVAASSKPAYNLTLKYPLEFATGMRMQLFTALASGQVQLHIWGHDEAVVV